MKIKTRKILFLSLIITIFPLTTLYSYFNKSSIINLSNSRENKQYENIKTSYTHWPLWTYSSEEPIYNLAFSTDGEYVAINEGSPSIISLFNRSNPIPLWSYNTGYIGYPTPIAIFSMDISLNGEYIVAGGGSAMMNYGKLYLFHKDNPNPIWTSDIDDVINTVSISADGQYIVVGADDNKIYLYDRTNNQSIWNYTFPYSALAEISTNGEYIIAGSLSNSKLSMFQRASNNPIINFTCDSNTWRFAISSDGYYITCGSNDGKIYLFNRSSTSEMWKYDTGVYIYTIDISADGGRISAGTSVPDNKLYYLDNTSTPFKWVYTNSSRAIDCKMSSNGSLIVIGTYAAGTAAGEVVLFNKSDTPLWRFKTGYDVREVGISADGLYIAAVSNGKLHIFHQCISGPDPNQDGGGGSPDILPLIVLSAPQRDATILYIVTGIVLLVFIFSLLYLRSKNK